VQCPGAVAGSASAPNPDSSVPDVTVSCGSNSVVQTLGSARGSADPPEKQGGLPQLLEALARLFSVIAWPLVAVASFLIYRAPITRLIDRLKSLKVSKEGLEFALGVAEAADKADIEPEPPTPYAFRDDAEIVAKTRVDARGTILAAWAQVEQAINEVVRARNLAPNFGRIERRPYTAMRVIQDAKLVDPKYVRLFEDLRTLRNQAAHAAEFDPPPESVLRYVGLVEGLTRELVRVAGTA
jgi:hypothetical protein